MGLKLELWSTISEFRVDDQEVVLIVLLKSIFEMSNICNYSGCPHGEGGDGDANRTQGHIKSVSELGMRAGMHTTTVEQSKKH